MDEAEVGRCWRPPATACCWLLALLVIMVLPPTAVRASDFHCSSPLPPGQQSSCSPLVEFDNITCIDNDLDFQTGGSTCELYSEPPSSNNNACGLSPVPVIGPVRVYQFNWTKSSFRSNYSFEVQGLDGFQPIFTLASCNSANGYVCSRSIFTNNVSARLDNVQGYENDIGFIVIYSINNVCGNYSFRMSEHTPPEPELNAGFIWYHTPMDLCIAFGLLAGNLIFVVLNAEDTIAWVIFDAAVCLGVVIGVLGVGTVIDPASLYVYMDNASLNMLVDNANRTVVPAFAFCLAFSVSSLLTLLFKRLASIQNVLVVATRKPAPVRGYLRRNKTAVISWKWDIKSATDFGSSETLSKCFDRAAELNFAYVAVDVITLDQKSVEPQAVIQFTDSYRLLPVIVGAATHEQIEEYKSRFWTNVEITNYRNNRKVYMLNDGLARPETIFRTKKDVALSTEVNATFDLDRLQMILLTVPFGVLFLRAPLRLIRRFEHTGINIPLSELEECMEYAFACRTIMCADIISRELASGTTWLSYMMTVPSRVLVTLIWVIFAFLPPLPWFKSLRIIRLQVIIYYIMFLVLVGVGIAVLLAPKTPPVSSPPEAASADQAAKASILATGLTILSVGLVIIPVGQIFMIVVAGFHICRILRSKERAFSNVIVVPGENQLK